jgi:hypothetical protein
MWGWAGGVWERSHNRGWHGHGYRSIVVNAGSVQEVPSTSAPWTAGERRATGWGGTSAQVPGGACGGAARGGPPADEALPHVMTRGGVASGRRAPTCVSVSRTPDGVETTDAAQALRRNGTTGELGSNGDRAGESGAGSAHRVCAASGQCPRNRPTAPRVRRLPSLLTGMTGDQPARAARPSEAAMRPVTSAGRAVTPPPARLHPGTVRVPCSVPKRWNQPSNRFRDKVRRRGSAPLTARRAGSTVSPRNLAVISRPRHHKCFRMAGATPRSEGCADTVGDQMGNTRTRHRLLSGRDGVKRLLVRVRCRDGPARAPDGVPVSSPARSPGSRVKASARVGAAAVLVAGTPTAPRPRGRAHHGGGRPTGGRDCSGGFDGRCGP